MILKWSFLIFLFCSFLTNAQKGALEESLKNYNAYLTEKKDSIFLQNVEHYFGLQLDDAETIHELRKLQSYESRRDITNALTNPKMDLSETRTYLKDSIQILLVKLVGIKRLDEKQLLAKDILEHKAYYTALLAEFKESELDPNTYMFFEQQVFKIHHKELEQKYSWSLLVNVLGVFSVLLLLFLMYRYKRKSVNDHASSLSRQENIIKALILDGKTNKEIANELFISVSTVKTHISNIYSKLHVSSRKELVCKE